MGKPFAPALISAALFFSCIGTDSAIQIRADGSGTMLLEYRIAAELEELGKLDGNERWLPVPAGRADMERSVDRIEGLKLGSYSEKKDGKDRIYTAKLEFASPQALTDFLDAGGSQAALDMNGRRLLFTFTEGAAGQELGEMLAHALSGYIFSLSVQLPSPVSLRWLDGNGKETAAPGRASVTGSSLSFSAPMADLVLLEEKLVMEITW